MKKYEKVLREDYEAWYRDTGITGKGVRADESRLAYHLMPENRRLNDPPMALPVWDCTIFIISIHPLSPQGRLSSGVTIPHGIFIHYVREEPALFRTRTWMPHGVYSGSAYVE